MKGKLAKAEAEVALLKERCQIYQNGIAERKPVIYGLAGLCIFLTLAFVAYIVIDLSDTAHGFIRRQRVSPVLVLLVLLIISAALGTAHSITKRKHNMKRNGENENN